MEPSLQIVDTGVLALPFAGVRDEYCPAIHATQTFGWHGMLTAEMPEVVKPPGGDGSANMISVLIVDDHPVAREGLHRVLEQCADITVVGEAANGDQALVLVNSLRPDVVLMDIRMPGTDGLEVTRQVKAAAPAISVIVMTNYEDDALMLDTIRVGASGFLLKDATRDLLFHTIHAVAAGGMLLDALVFRRALTSQVPSGTVAGDVALERQPPLPVTDNDTQVLRLMAEGCSNREIARIQGLPELAAKKKVQALVSSLRATNRTHAVAIAVRRGLIG